MSEDHDWVRRLLAEAGQSAETMPPEVTARMERVIEELSGSGSGADADAGPPVEPRPPASGVVVMTRPRHRRWAGALLAAAAITVGGYSLAATGVLGMGGAGSESAQDAAAGEALEEPPDAATEGSARSGAEGGSAAAGRDADSSGGVLRAPKAPSLSSTSLRRDVARLVVEEVPRGSLRELAPEAQSSREPSAAPERPACVPPPASVPGLEIAVTYDALPATVVVDRVRPGRAEVQVWACDSPVRLARVVVPR